ncbi:MAG: hypothetical protein O3B42_03645 [Actinomycetota bacterium]|nr:hypothetical protein [Actinomycetota bacterium]
MPNIARGVDHDLEAAPPTPTDHQGISNAPNIYKEDVQCSSIAHKIQAVRTETGNKQKVIIDGFAKGSGIFDGRLTLGLPDREFSYYSTMIDDVKTRCPGTDTETEIVACVIANPGAILFDDDIQNSTRLARVPVLHQTEWPTGSKYVSFKRFSSVYIQALSGGCKNDGSCDLAVGPGLPGPK